MDWQPIESAPKDGTVIIVFDSRWVWPAAYSEIGADGDPDYPWVLLDVDGGTNGLMDSEHGPTHWMPLPAAPLQDSE